MKNSQRLHGNKIFSVAAVATLCLTLAACSVSVKDHNNGDNSKVDIETPFGGIHVNEDVDVRDTGLALYPGARKKLKTNDGEDKSANVNISSSFFGVKVVAAEFESDDAPAKIIAYYKDQLKKYGNVLECHTSRHVSNFTDLQTHANDNHPHDLKCDADESGNATELKVGTEENQHIAFVEPSGKGSDFALAYVVTRGKEGSI